MQKLSVFIDALEPEIKRFKSEFQDYLKSGVFVIDQINCFIVRGQGKQFRPMLTFLSAKLVGESSDLTVKSALIVELLHTATLVHDDIVDESDKRRGLPAVKKLWGNKIAVLYGDYLLAHSLTAMLELRDLRVFDILSMTSRRLAKGELVQAAKAKKLDINESVYLKMISDKTAALISAAAELGALTAGGDEVQCEALNLYGENLGMAFQIRDDILDFIGREGLLGKPVGSDLKEGKITLPLIYSLENSQDGIRKEMLRAIRRRKYPKKVIEFVRNCNGSDYAQRKAEGYAQKAADCLNNFKDCQERELLLQMTEFAVRRNK
ncbi:MAG: polyprenyl synthetase family protein [candidate division Zixibacteria bacterium]|nr:polyprenyl synthetase family protein [Candidatus Tariuqbacter arcticus]